jgi:hypothetical protein
MGLLTVLGTYKDDRVELAERPENVDEAAPVLVTFLSSSAAPEKPTAVADRDRETLRQRAFARMKKGIHFGGPPYPKREDLYDGFDRQRPTGHGRYQLL